MTLRGETLGERSVEACAQACAVLIEDVDRIGGGGDRPLPSPERRSAARRLAADDRPRRARRLGGEDARPSLAIEAGADREAVGVDQELTEAVLFKLFSDRQLLVDPQVVAYIALRVERSLGAAREIVAVLDHEALSQGRRVTRAMASEALREMSSKNNSP